MSASIVVAYPFTPEQLAAKVDDLRGQIFITPAAYKDGVKAIATCREMRVAVEERRKALKHDSLEYGRKVDAVAKQLTDIILNVEEPLKAAKKEIDDGKERAKREAAEAERRRVEEDIRAKREAEEAVLREQRQAEEQRLAEERRQLEAERKRVAAEREELEHLRGMQRKMQEELDAQEKSAKAEHAAKERAERLRIEAEERRLNELEAEAQRKKRIDALKPDQDKLTQIARAIRGLAPQFAEYDFESESACEAAERAMESLAAVAFALEAWKETQA